MPVIAWRTGPTFSTRPWSDVEAGEDLLLRGLEDAVEPAEDDQRQDDPPVLGLLVVAPEQVGDRPDEAARGC